MWMWPCVACLLGSVIGSALVQDMLLLDVTPKYHLKWITYQWDKWQQLMVDLHLPHTGLLPSEESMKRKATSASKRGDADAAKSILDSMCMDEWACSTTALIALLTRFALNLGPSSRLRARFFLEAVLKQSLPRDLDHIMLSRCVPGERVADGMNMFSLRVADGMLDMSDVFLKVPRLRRLLRSPS